MAEVDHPVYDHTADTGIAVTYPYCDNEVKRILAYRWTYLTVDRVITYRWIYPTDNGLSTHNKTFL